MFDEIGRPELSPVTRRRALLYYGICSAVGLLGTIAILWRHGVAKPFNLVVPSLVFVVPMIWIVTTLRLGPPAPRRFNNQLMFLLILTGIENTVRMLFM